MIDLYYWTTPNGHKITLFLEESGLPYRILPINIGKGEQFQPDFLRIAPNNRIPAIVDTDPAGGGEPISVFESGAILLYLAEKSGRFLSVSCTRPRYHTTEDGRWDFRVTIVFKNVVAAHEPAAGEAAIKQTLYPDQETFRREEQHRFEILLAHWDLPIVDEPLGG